MTKNWQGLEQLGDTIIEIDNHISNIAEETATDLIEGGTVDNAKPIYCHPLEIYYPNVGVLTALIFNNSSEKINSWTKLKNAIATFGDSSARLLVSGGLIDSNASKNVIASEIYLNKSTNIYLLLGMATDGTIYNVGAGFNITNFDFQVQDDVNKIN